MIAVLEDGVPTIQSAAIFEAQTEMSGGTGLIAVRDAFQISTLLKREVLESGT